MSVFLTRFLFREATTDTLEGLEGLEEGLEQLGREGGCSSISLVVVDSTCEKWGLEESIVPTSGDLEEFAKIIGRDTSWDSECAKIIGRDTSEDSESAKILDNSSSTIGEGG